MHKFYNKYIATWEEEPWALYLTFNENPSYYIVFDFTQEKTFLQHGEYTNLSMVFKAFEASGAVVAKQNDIEKIFTNKKMKKGIRRTVSNIFTVLLE